MSVESFSIGLNDEEAKGKGDILDDEEPPYFDKEVKPHIPFYKTKIFLIVASIISIILIIVIVVFVLIITILDNICDIENGYYIPKDKTNEKKCLKCDLNCKICSGNISYSQCNSCFYPFIPSYYGNNPMYCSRKCEEGERKSCKTCDTYLNKCTACNSGYFIPEDEKSQSNCQKCAVDKCLECSGTKNSNKCKACINLYKPIYEGNEIVKCLCEVGENEKCMKCDKNECIACNEGYKLLKGKCASYSFKAVYKTTSVNESIELIKSYYYAERIENLIINENEITPCTKYVFPKPWNS